MQVTTVGLDIAKLTFHAVGFDARGKEVWRKRLKRERVREYFARLAPCEVALEACAGAHYWARRLGELGHEARLLHPKHVKAFCRRAKNDYNDARALAEAVRSGQMRFVGVKDEDSQALQAVHRLRAGVARERTALINQVRGLLGEFGVVLPRGAGVVRRRLPEVLEDAENGLTGPLREVLAEAYERLVCLDERLKWYTRKLEALRRRDPVARRLGGVRGFGPVVATAARAKLGDGRGWRNGREFSASLGIVPRQHSTGGKVVLLGITKRGDRYLRTQLIHGARAVLAQAEHSDDKLSRWARSVKARRGAAVATVAVANKLARIAWAMVRWGEEFDPARA
jgi:transposase